MWRTGVDSTNVQASAALALDGGVLSAPASADAHQVREAVGAVVQSNDPKALSAIFRCHHFEMANSTAKLLGVFGMALKQFRQLDPIGVSDYLTRAIAAKHVRKWAVASPRFSNRMTPRSIGFPAAISVPQKRQPRPPTRHR